MENMGRMKNYRDYLPLEKDCSNIEEVLEIFNDTDKCLEVIENCKNTFLHKKKSMVSP